LATVEGRLLLVGGFHSANGGASGTVFDELWEYEQGRILGSACAQPEECLSGLCVDGVCCDLPCGAGDPTDCQACSRSAGAPADGHCVPMAVGTLCRAASGECDAEEQCDGAAPLCPDDRPASAGEACSEDGEVCTADVCDGQGLCIHPAGNAGTQCRAAQGDCDVAEACDGLASTCPDDKVSPEGFECRGVRGECDQSESCDGAAKDCPLDTFLAHGTLCRSATCADSEAVLSAYCTGLVADCPALQTQACGPYPCAGPVCAGPCANDLECHADAYCSAGVCASKKAIGDSCGGANQCLSGFCADGVCCSSACQGQCEGCAEEDRVGTCVAVVGAPRNGRTACATDGSVCAGRCDGEARATCVYPGPELQCRDPSCSESVAVLAASCNGEGSCPAVQTQTCEPAGCDGDACIRQCEDDEGCPGDRFCSAGVCVPLLELGATCAADRQCQSERCVDGHCCDSSCQGQCEACNVSERLAWIIHASGCSA